MLDTERAHYGLRKQSLEYIKALAEDSKGSTGITKGQILRESVKAQYTF